MPDTIRTIDLKPIPISSDRAIHGTPLLPFALADAVPVALEAAWAIWGTATIIIGWRDPAHAGRTPDASTEEALAALPWHEISGVMLYSDKASLQAGGLRMLTDPAGGTQFLLGDPAALPVVLTVLEHFLAPGDEAAEGLLTWQPILPRLYVPPEE